MSMKVTTTNSRSATAGPAKEIMTKDELIDFAVSKISDLRHNIADIEEDFDEYVENVASNGNHDDTFNAGLDYGHTLGRIAELENLIEILEDTPNAEHKTN